MVLETSKLTNELEKRSQNGSNGSDRRDVQGSDTNMVEDFDMFSETLAQCPTDVDISKNLFDWELE